MNPSIPMRLCVVCGTPTSAFVNVRGNACCHDHLFAPVNWAYMDHPTVRTNVQFAVQVAAHFPRPQQSVAFRREYL